MDASKQWLLAYFPTAAAAKRHLKNVNELAEEIEAAETAIRETMPKRERFVPDEDFLAKRAVWVNGGTAVRRRIRREQKRRQRMEMR